MLNQLTSLLGFGPRIHGAAQTGSETRSEEFAEVFAEVEARGGTQGQGEETQGDRTPLQSEAEAVVATDEIDAINTYEQDDVLIGPAPEESALDLDEEWASMQDAGASLVYSNDRSGIPGAGNVAPDHSVLPRLPPPGASRRAVDSGNAELGSAQASPLLTGRGTASRRSARADWPEQHPPENASDTVRWSVGEGQPAVPVAAATIAGQYSGDAATASQGSSRTLAAGAAHLFSGGNSHLTGGANPDGMHWPEGDPLRDEMPGKSSSDRIPISDQRGSPDSRLNTAPRARLPRIIAPGGVGLSDLHANMSGPDVGNSSRGVSTAHATQSVSPGAGRLVPSGSTTLPDGATETTPLPGSITDSGMTQVRPGNLPIFKARTLGGAQRTFRSLSAIEATGQAAPGPGYLGARPQLSDQELAAQPSSEREVGTRGTAFGGPASVDLHSARAPDHPRIFGGSAFPEGLGRQRGAAQLESPPRPQASQMQVRYAGTEAASSSELDEVWASAPSSSSLQSATGSQAAAYPAFASSRAGRAAPMIPAESWDRSGHERFERPTAQGAVDSVARPPSAGSSAASLPFATVTGAARSLMAADANYGLLPGDPLETDDTADPALEQGVDGEIFVSGRSQATGALPGQSVPLISAARTDGAAVARQMAEGMARLHEGTVELRLSPEELGRVRMVLHQGEHGLTVHIQADRPETLDLLRRNIDELARHLGDAGYEGAGFSFGDGQEGGGDQPGLADVPLPADPDLPPEAAPAWSDPNGLDIRI